MRRVYVESLGCAANRVDGERVRAMCRSGGWEATNDPAAADLLVVMTCGFTQYQEGVNLRRISELQALKRAGAELVVGGCLPSINPKAVREVHEGFSFGPRTLDVFRRRYVAAAAPDAAVATVTPSDEEPGVCLVRVATGCMDRCAYCAIPMANGRIVSRSFEQIDEDIHRGFEAGYRVFHLVGEDIGAWGLERKLSVLDLLDHVLASPLPVRFRLHNLNPNWLKRYLEPILERLRSDRIVKKFYIPVQSGSDAVLRRMRRRYTADEVREVFHTFRQKLSEALFSSDWIVGFPGEAEAEFEETRCLFAELEIDYASIYKYEDRPRVEAERLPEKTPDFLKEARARALIAEMLKSLTRRRGLISVEELAESLGPTETLPINTNVAPMIELLALQER